MWQEIERGTGARLPFRAVAHGDERCSRTVYGFFLGDRCFPFLDDEVPADLRVRDRFFRSSAG